MRGAEAATREFRVDVGGVTVVGHEHGDRRRRTVLLLHGYPDDSTLWDQVVPTLAEEFHVVTYDVRGHGDSDDPGPVEAYAFDHLMDDLLAVVDHVSPDRAVHLVGHDWGAIQGWEAATRPDVADRLASFTAMSAPSLDLAGRWVRDRLRVPSVKGAADLARQALKSWYVAAFQVPVVPEAVLRTGILGGLSAIVPAFDGLARPEEEDAGRRRRNAENGVALYRANLQRVRAPRRSTVHVPVQVVSGEHDAFASPALYADLDRYADDVLRRTLPGARHWLPRTHPQEVASAVGAFVAHVADRAPRPAEDVHAPSAPPGPWAGRVVVVTGAGNGIGRATAIRSADRGATVVVADIDVEAAERTATFVRHVGAAAHVHRVDVADREAMEAFVSEVLDAHGVPDVVVNNAGIGMAGAFLDTTPEDWERILGVNLWGVIHGARGFGAAMAGRGTGHLVNVSSGLAFAPASGMSAYATTKAAVLMLSEVLRAELADAGVGVSAVCPGVIDTGITERTSFVGVDDEEQDRRRRRTSDLYQRRSLGPDAVADAILRAVDDDEPVVPVGIEARAGQFAWRVAPDVVRRLARVDLVGR